MEYTLTLNAPDYLSFTPVVLSGDFKVTISNFNATSPTDDFIRTIGEASNSNNFLLYRNDGTNNAWNFRANNVTGVFPTGAAKPTTENGDLTFQRVGSTGTITYLGVTTTATVPTDNFTLSGFNVTNNSSSNAVFGNVVVEQAGSIVYNWDFDNTDHALTNVTETITGNTAIGSGVVVGDWTRIPFNWAGSQLSFNAIPNGAQGQNPSGGWTCTGLDRLSNGNWLVGNAGQAASDGTPLNPSLVILSSDYSTIVQELDMFGVIGANTIQGVAVDTDGTYWLASGNIGVIVHVTSAGVEIERFAIPSVNGLALDSTRGTAGSLWYCTFPTAGLVIKRWDIALETTVTADNIALPAGASIPDQLHYNSNLIYLTQGGSGEDGDIYVFDATSKEHIAYIAPLAQAQAIEGAYISGNVLYIANDGGYHTNATPAISAIIEYDITGAFSTLNITATGTSNGTYKTLITNPENDTTVFVGSLLYSSNSSSTDLVNVVPGTKITGFAIDNEATHVNGAVITGTTV
jgi:hypothetical protein